MKPPEIIPVGDLVLKRWEPQWAPEATAAIGESLPELEPFLPWAKPGYDLGLSRDFIDRSVAGWAEGTEFNYAIFTAGGELAGAIGLMTRMGPGILEIGYWMRTRFAGRGHMTAAVVALTRVAHGLPGVDRVAIRHDAANAASGAVAARAGFVEVERVAHDPQAPGETGTDVIRVHRLAGNGKRPA